MTRSTSLPSLGAVIALLGLSSFGLLGGACATHDESDAEHLGSADSALTDAQCAYFDVNGKIQICHHTGSAKHPYTIIRTSVQACADAFAAHAGDYVTSTDPTSPLYDPTCQGGGCLPAGAPSDATLPCCDGLVSQNGTCTDPCDADPCQNGGSCAATSTGYTCACPAGYTGTNCQINIDECENAPCLHGSCTDGVNSYTCACDPGWTGTDCETPTCVPTTCAAEGATCGTIPDGCGGTLECGAACAYACPCEALPAWQEVVAANSYDGCFSFAPNDVYLRGVASYYPGDGTAIRTGMFATPANEMMGDPQQCGAVSTQSGVQTLPVTDEQLLACAQIVVQSSGGLCQ